MWHDKQLHAARRAALPSPTTSPPPRPATHLLTKSPNPLIILRVLVCKLIARESQHYQPLVLVLLVQVLELSKLRRKATLGRRVDNQDDFALERGKVVRVALGSLGFEVVELDHGCACACACIGVLMWLEGKIESAAAAAAAYLKRLDISTLDETRLSSLETEGANRSDRPAAQSAFPRLSLSLRTDVPLPRLPTKQKRGCSAVCGGGALLEAVVKSGLSIVISASLNNTT